MKKREFPASYPLLGLLLWGPATGYELRRRAEASLSFFWHEGYAQIYPSLEHFRCRGLAEVVAEDQGSRRRRVFAITDQGRYVFREWLRRPVESYDPRRHELLVKVLFARELEPSVLAAHLDRYQQLQRGWVAQLESLSGQLIQESSSDPNLPAWLATVRHGLVLGQALVAWSQETKQTLTTEALVTSNQTDQAPSP